ncbi:histidine kinase dimerization/phospho-acceptor domain-containing protein, partial [Shewanella sp. 0m-11]
MDTSLLLNHLVTAVIVTNEELELLYVNAAAEQLLGVGSHRLSEHPLPEHYQLLGVDPQVLKLAIFDGQGLSINTVSLVTLDGQQHTVDVTLTPLEQEQNLALIEFRQVDQQRRIHQQLTQDAQQQAAQYLVRNLAHEIKNPLGGLRGAAQLLSRELKEPELNEFTDLIIEQADRLRNLV